MAGQSLQTCVVCEKSQEIQQIKTGIQHVVEDNRKKETGVRQEKADSDIENGQQGKNRRVPEAWAGIPVWIQIA